MRLDTQIDKHPAGPMRMHILIIAFIVLAVYYPALSAEISIIDDLDMVSSLLNTEDSSLLDIFIPRSTGGGYYRPLLGLSQYIDKQFWLMSSQFMHLENIIFHLINAILVYLLAVRLSVRLACKADGVTPLAAALIFALHPINTESVNWISGRTDSMACNFILVSVIFLFRYREERKIRNLFISGVALVLSLFAKEVAFGYLLALPFLLLFPLENIPEFTEPAQAPSKNICHPLITFLLFFAGAVLAVLFAASYWTVLICGCGYLLYSLLADQGEKPLLQIVKDNVTALKLLALTLTATFTLFYLLRKIAFTSNIDRISNTLQLIFQDTGYAISLFLGAAGFYVKKFFWPVPLNFFILEINPLYDFLGIAVFLFVVWLVLKKNVFSVLSIAGMCTVLPAFPFAFGTIAWTGYAERYIYVASAFWSVAVTLFAGHFLVSQNLGGVKNKISLVSIGLLLLIMASVTWQRNIAWQTNLDLLADTVKQTPGQKELRGMYMLAYIRSGNLKAAREQYEIASHLQSGKYLEHIDLNMAGIEATEGNKAEAEALFIKAISRTHGKSATALKFYAKFLDTELMQATDKESILLLQSKVIPIYERLYAVNHDPFVLYRLGQIHLSRNDIRCAITSFELAAQAYQPHSMYGENSAKIVKKLKNQEQQLKGG